VYISSELNVNKLLPAHIGKHGTLNMTFSILEWWDVGTKDQEKCQRIESSWKIKLDSRFGSNPTMCLNDN
jgi:hypothetical protein